MIGIFDSGLGGIPIWEKIVHKLPNEDYVYVADQGHLPYENKSDEYIVDRVKRITDYLRSEGAKTIVVACNTATAAAIEKIRRDYEDMVFVGVEPAIKPANLQGRGVKVLVLGTKSTLNSGRFKKSLDRFGSGLKIKSRSVSEWVTQVEKGLINTPPIISKDLLAAIKSAEVILLACTHYIFFTDYLKSLFPNKMIIEPSEAVAKRTKIVHNNATDGGQKLFISTSNSNQVSEVLKNLLSWEVRVQYKDL